jgi:hypothetical protein
MKYVASVHKYSKEPGALAEAFRKLAAEANKVARDGYRLLGYQVVESERIISAMYFSASPDAGGASLVGE